MTPHPAQPLGKALLDWFAEHARPLPWRPNGAPSAALRRALERDPAYVLLLVEVMSQQTRIDTVAARLTPFLERFPTRPALASAPLEAVLDAWSGLGYYRRARALHEAARVVEEGGAGWPQDEAGWRRLPGIGAYAAAALAAQLSGFAAAAIDGNVRRVLARLTHQPAPSEAELRAALAAHFGLDGSHDPERAQQVEALIELGATLCTPRAPHCLSCPLTASCEARRAGTTASVPAAKRRAAPRGLALHALLLERDGGLIAFERRPREGLWGGTLGLPWRREAPPEAELIGRFEHRLSHRLIEASLYRPTTAAAAGDLEWHPADRELPELDRRALALALCGAREARSPETHGSPNDGAME